MILTVDLQFRMRMFSGFLSQIISQIYNELHYAAANILHCFHHQGYSSLRFRPIRHLSSPVEDLEMCKVVGVTDKVKQTFLNTNIHTWVFQYLCRLVALTLLVM